MAVEVEPVESIIRVFRGRDSSEKLDQFVATCTVHYHGNVAVLYGAHGNVTIRDLRDTYQLCRANGAKWLLAHRRDGHTIPCANLMPDGPFEGWWFVNLETSRL